MDLRKILILFVLALFLFSINIYSSSVFNIENITHLPPDTEGNDYIMGYYGSGKYVIIGVYRSSRSVKFFNITENGVCDENGNLLTMVYRVYNPDTNEWSIAIGHEHSSWFTELGAIPCFSSKDVYRNGRICVFGREYDGNLGVLGGLTSSVIFVGLLKPFLKLMPFILSFVVLIFMFYKLWKFIKGVF